MTSVVPWMTSVMVEVVIEDALIASSKVAVTFVPGATSTAAFAGDDAVTVGAVVSGGGGGGGASDTVTLRLPVIVIVTVSVPVMVCDPAVVRVAANVACPSVSVESAGSATPADVSLLVKWTLPA